MDDQHGGDPIVSNNKQHGGAIVHTRLADFHSFSGHAARRLPAERKAAVIEARLANPDAPQNEIAQQAGVSRSGVQRIEGRWPPATGRSGETCGSVNCRYAAL